MLDGESISLVLDQYGPERAALLGLLGGLSPEQWQLPTECPAYSIKDLASHVLGDDLSLLSRQRDQAENGLVLLAKEMPGADFRTLLDAFNDRWVASSSFFSTDLLCELLRLTGIWTATYYTGVDPNAAGESVGFFGAVQSGHSPFWQAIAREFMERWIHHGQISRALGSPLVSDRGFVATGVEIVAAIARVEPGIPDQADGEWAVGAVSLGPIQQAADILTRRHSSDEVRQLAQGPAEIVDVMAAVLGRP